jgi:hypothetical protein
MAEQNTENPRNPKITLIIPRSVQSSACANRRRRRSPRTPRASAANMRWSRSRVPLALRPCNRSMQVCSGRAEFGARSSSFSSVSEVPARHPLARHVLDSVPYAGPQRARCRVAAVGRPACSGSERTHRDALYLRQVMTCGSVNRMLQTPCSADGEAIGPSKTLSDRRSGHTLRLFGRWRAQL